jgi:hypothetical protein
LEGETGGRGGRRGDGETGMGGRETGRWGDGETGRWGDGEMGRRGDGETGGTGRWGDGEGTGRWGDGGDGEMGRRGGLGDAATIATRRRGDAAKRPASVRRNPLTLLRRIGQLFCSTRDGAVIYRTFPTQRFAPEILSISPASATTFPGELHPSSTRLRCPFRVTVISTSGKSTQTSFFSSQ